MVDSDLWRRAKVLLELAVRKSTTVSGMVGPSATTEQPDSEFSPLRPSLVGRMLGRYRLEEQIGAGGMGEVYRAHDERLNRVVAVKVIAPNFLANAQARERFEQEAQAIAALSHPNICILYDAASIDGVEFLVIEHLEGETLAARIARQGEGKPLPLYETLHIAIRARRGRCWCAPGRGNPPRPEARQCDAHESGLEAARLASSEGA